MRINIDLGMGKSDKVHQWKDTNGTHVVKKKNSRKVSNILQRNYKILSNRPTVTNDKFETVRSYQTSRY